MRIAVNRLPSRVDGIVSELVAPAGNQSCVELFGRRVACRSGDAHDLFKPLCLATKISIIARTIKADCQ